MQGNSKKTSSALLCDFVVGIEKEITQSGYATAVLTVLENYKNVYT